MISRRIEHLGFPSDTLICGSAGHGGVYNGKYTTAPAKMNTFHKGTKDEFTFYEGVFNRQLTHRIIEYLYQSKRNFSFINPGPEDIHPRRRGQMCDIAHNNSRLPYAFGFEIHANYFSKESVKGFEIYTSPGITPSDRIATCIYEHVEKANIMPMRPGITKYDPDVDKEANFAFLLGGAMPLVLIEVDFFSNEDVARSLMDPIYQDSIAKPIAFGLIEASDKKLYKYEE